VASSGNEQHLKTGEHLPSCDRTPLFLPARDCDGAFFDAGTVATASPIDGVHLDAMNTRAIGEALVPIVVDIFRRRR